MDPLERTVRVKRICALICTTCLFALTMMLAILGEAPLASAQPPPSGPSKHCVSDNTDSYFAGKGYKAPPNFIATACEYRSGNSMNVGLTWNVPDRYPSTEHGVDGGSVLFYQLIDCATNKVVLDGVHNFTDVNKLYPLSGSAGSSTITVPTNHRYKARITGDVYYEPGDGIRFEISEYPPLFKNLDSFDSYSPCYSS